MMYYLSRLQLGIELIMIRNLCNQYNFALQVIFSSRKIKKCEIIIILGGKPENQNQTDEVF